MNLLKPTIILRSNDVLELVREGLARRGIVVEGDLDTCVVFKPQESGDFVVEVRDVVMAPPTPPPPPSVAEVEPPSSTRPRRELPDDDAPPAKPAPTKKLNLKKKETVDGDVDDESVSMAALQGESARLLRETTTPTEKKPNPSLDAMMLGGLAHKNLSDFGIDPNEVTQDELYPGPKGG